MSRVSSAVDPSAISWAQRAISPAARCVAAERAGGATGPWLLRFDDGGAHLSAVLRVGDPSSNADRRRLRVEATALAAAQRCGVAAPRLIASCVDGSSTAAPCVLSTLVAGVSTIPERATERRLRALGAAVASLTSCSSAVDDLDLPVRDRPLSDVDFGDPSTPLLRSASAAVAAWRPSGPNVLVHGDCWQGNLLWCDDEFSGFVDWDAAGMGPAGLDLGSIRFDAALYFGSECVDRIARGWRAAGGPAVDDLAYWDLVAALASPEDLTSWMPVIGAPGRHDLSVDTVASRRDDFVAAALRTIG